MREIKLHVEDALQDDAYKGIVRINKESMKKLGVHRGDVINIEGKRKTCAIVDKSYPKDSKKDIIRLDGILRKNSKTGLKKKVKISRADVREVEKVIIAPIQKHILVQAESDSLKRGLLGRSVVKNDLIVLGGISRREKISNEFGGDMGDMLGDMLGNMGLGGVGGFTQIKFEVVDLKPNGPAVITENTDIVLEGRAREKEKNKDIVLKDKNQSWRLKDSEIIKLKKLPDLKNYHETKNIEEFGKILSKLKGQFFVNSFETKTKTYYFIGDYLFISNKSGKKKKSKKKSS